MADQIKELIEKINQEGIQTAEAKAREIEVQAQEKARLIVEKAEAAARNMTEEARDRISRLEKSSQDALNQSARDMLLALKGDILAMLEHIIAADAASALKPEELARIITAVVKEYCSRQDTMVTVYLKDSDKTQLEKHFLGRLKDELKKGIELRRQDDIHSGFIISFDAGKSRFDFSDNSLAQYLSIYLKPKVAELLKDIK